MNSDDGQREPYHKNVLLVDDDPSTLRLVSAQLRSHFGDQLTIFEAETASHAIALLEAHAISLVITDLDMDRTNGFHLLKHVKEKEPIVQVLILTGHESSNALRSAFSMGADDFMVKPFRIGELTTSIEYLLARLSRWRETVHGLQFSGSQTNPAFTPTSQ